GLLGQSLGRLLQHVLAAATDHNVRAELEEAVAHRAAESRAATSHQNALALQEVGLKHRILNSWPWPLAGFHVRVSATSAVELRMRSAARRDALAFRWRAALATSDVGPRRPRSETSPTHSGGEVGTVTSADAPTRHKHHLVNQRFSRRSLWDSS